MHILKAHSPSATFENLKMPAIISSLLVLPFMVLELVNLRNLGTGFPVVLFVMMWGLALAFISILIPILRSLQPGHRIVPNAIVVLPKIVLLIGIAWFWMALVVDQMPCFLGVPNCD